MTIAVDLGRKATKQTNKPPRTTIRVSNSLDPDRHSSGLHLGSNRLQKGYWQTTNLSTGMQRVITGKYFSVQYIVSYRDIHASCIP